MKFLIAIAFTLISIILPHSASAHINGVPFVLVNNKPVLANPAFTGYIDQKMLIPQDLAPDKYLPNTPLTLTIDPNALGFPQETLNQSKIRWSWDTGSTQYNTDRNPQHTYTQIGSHIITMEILFPGNTEYVVYDTIQVDVVPHLGYQRPNSIITTNGINADTTQEITFTQKTTTDPTSSIESYLWKLDSGVYSTDPEPKYNYKRTNFFEQVYLQVTDSKGFLSTTAISVTNGPTSTLSQAPALSKQESSFPWTPFLLVSSVLTCAALVYWKFTRTKA